MEQKKFSYLEFARNEGYSIAKCLWIGLLAYLVLGPGTHYIFDYNARDAHGLGIIVGFISFVIALVITAKKKGWLDKIEMED